MKIQILLKNVGKMLKGVTLDVCNRDLMALFYDSKLWFYSFDICNPNHNFISINENEKRGCLVFKT